MHKRGIDHVRDPRLNKGLAFGEEEKDKLNIRGLIPAGFVCQDVQLRVALENIRSIKEGILKYIYLTEIQCANERLYFRLLSEYTEELLPVVYTPVVGEACLSFSRLYVQPRGLFISAKDVGKVKMILDNWPEKNVQAICVTDGERILGLGDLGANGMGIPIGKLALYTALAGILPSITLPITLDVGTNNESLLADPTYMGLKQKRITRQEYDTLLDEFMNAVVEKYGRACLIQFEDFGISNAWRLLFKYRDNFCTFNDDIQGTASVTVGGIIACCNLTKRKLKDNVFLLFGAGSAGMGIAGLLYVAIMHEGLSEEDAKRRIWLMDVNGLLTESRRDHASIDDLKKTYLKKVKPTNNLEEVVEIARPSVLIGASAQPGVFNETILRMMAAFNDNPLIFPLSNPTSKSECTAKDAYNYTDGRCIFASGSPFDPVVYNGRTFYPSQANNSYIFPGLSLAVIACKVHTIPRQTFIVAAQALAEYVTKDNLAQGRVYPPPSSLRAVSQGIAAHVAQYFFRAKLATVKSEPADKLQFIKNLQYNYYYDEKL